MKTELMDVTQLSEKEKIERSKKMMLWFGIVSLIMGFAGWTSAYIVSSARKDWMESLELPQLFYVSTVVIILSSLTYILAKNAIKRDNHKQTTIWLLTTLVLGIGGIAPTFKTKIHFNKLFRAYAGGNFLAFFRLALGVFDIVYVFCEINDHKFGFLNGFRFCKAKKKCKFAPIIIIR